MEFVDLKAQYKLVEKEVNRRIRIVLERGQYIMGPEIQELEERLADYVGVKYCIGVSSGTDALLVALMALGVGRDDEVITTPFSFIATAGTIALLGATPVFVDIDPRTYNIDPGKIKDAITSKTRAVLAVSLYGQCAEFDAINSIAEMHNIPVIEDGAQSFGATYKGRKSCGLSTIGCTSFFPSKPLGGYGDGGACFTNSEDLAGIMREVRVHGQRRRYHHSRIGINGRLDTLQAAILLAKFDLFPDEVARRSEIGEQYTELLMNAAVTPYIEPYNTSVYAQYTVQVDERDKIQAALKAQGIPSAVHYPVPLYSQPALKQKEMGLKNAEYVSARVMSLPMHPNLDSVEQRRIVDALLTEL